MLLTSIRFFAFFGKGLETAPLHRANAQLKGFLRERVEKERYESSFSAYQSYLEKVIIDNPTVDHNKVSLLDHCTKIYSIYKIPSKKLNKLHNHIADECLQLCEKEGVECVVTLLEIIHRYNPKKSIAIFRTYKQSIIKQMRTFSPPILLNLIKFLKDARIDEAIIRQTCIQMLYKQIEYMNELQMLLISNYLTGSKKYINKDFLTKFAKRVTVLYKSGNFHEKYMYGMLSSLSEIQTNLHTRSIYVDELDELYEVAFPSLFENINGLDDRNLNQLTSALRRSKHYNETMVRRLMETTLRRDIKELMGQEPKNKNTALSLATFVNIVNAVAVFNFHIPEFKQYVLSVLKIVSLNKQDLLTPGHFSRLVWSVCIIFDRGQVGELYPLIQRYLSKPQQMPLHEAMNFYYCYLYLRTSFPKINDFREKIHSSLANFTLQTHTSHIQNQAFEVMKSLGIPCLMEYNLNNLICDMMIPEWKSLRNVIIQFHGFRHFFRNAKKLTGSNILKQKIIRSEQYKYYFISIDEWLIVENKKEFLSSFMEHINELEATSKGESLVVARTATRVRSRPRLFRLAQ